MLKPTKASAQKACSPVKYESPMRKETTPFSRGCPTHHRVDPEVDVEGAFNPKKSESPPKRMPIKAPVPKMNLARNRSPPGQAVPKPSQAQDGSGYTRKPKSFEMGSQPQQSLPPGQADPSGIPRKMASPPKESVNANEEHLNKDDGLQDTKPANQSSPPRRLIMKPPVPRIRFSKLDDPNKDLDVVPLESQSPGDPLQSSSPPKQKYGGTSRVSRKPSIKPYNANRTISAIRKRNSI